jgi:Ca2+-binding EF-hand superfamily protein
MLQRPVPALQFTVVAEKSAPGGKGQPVKTALATTVLDLSTLVSAEEHPVVSLLLPVKHASASSAATTLVSQRSDIAGWLLVGLRFLPSSPALEIKSDLEALQAAMLAQWAALAAFPTQYCLGVGSNPDADTGATLRALQGNPAKLCTNNVHIALASLQFASQRFVADTFSGCEVGAVTCVIRAGGDPTCSAQIMGHIQGDRVAWYRADGVVKVLRESSVSMVLSVQLFKGEYDAALGDCEDAIAEAIIPVSREQLDKGLPFNFLLPLRDKRGERAASLTMSVQLTTLGGDTEAALADTAGSALLTSATGQVPSAASPSVPLRVEFCEGNIADSEQDERVEPFFECSLLLPEQEELLANASYATKARTGFLRMTDKLESWRLDCLVHVPPASVASMSLASSTMLTASRTRPGFDAAQLSTGACILGVVCRDASKQGCPEIGWARIALPRQLILHGKAVEQWITLSPPNSASGNTQRVHSSGATGGKHSRMRIKVSVDHNNYDAAYAPFGVGAVLLRAVGVHDFRAGMNDSLVQARLSAYSWPRGVPVDPSELREEQLFAQLSAHPAAYINEMAIFNQDSLVAALPVPGGFGDVRLDVKTFTTNTAYSTSFPIMATTTKCAAGAELPAIPVLSLNLSRERSPELSKTDPNRPQRARLEPQLQVAAAYVPYVTGKLVLHCTGIELLATSSNSVPRAAVLRSGDSPLALRYLLGNNSSKFMFSRPFAAGSGPSSAGAARSLGGPPTLAESPNITFLEVDTFEVISTSIRRGEHMSMMPLFVSLLEQWDLLDPVVERRGQQSCVGVGYVPTAVCYYQAMRAAASAPMEARADSSSVVGSPAASPWLASIVDIFDPSTKLKVAVLHLNIQFVMTGVPEHVLRLLGSTVCRFLSDPSAKARVELGLKQSFVLADADRSGAVSSEELLQVISQAGSGGGKGSLQRQKASRTGTGTVGMENSVGLLLQLANLPEDDLDGVNPDTARDVVRRIFAQLDVDGDGLVSWWEWKSVLTASILGHNPTSTQIFHLDALVVGLLAACDAIKSLSLSSKLQSLGDQYAGVGSVELNAVLPYIRLRVAGYDATSMEAIAVQDDDTVSVGSAPSKTVSRLHSMVKSLRLTNSALAKRFERALATAQNLAINLDQDTQLVTQSGATGAADNRHGAKLSEIEALEQRVQDTAHQSEQNLSSFLTAKERADRLTAQLNELKTLAAVAQAGRAQPEAYSFNAHLEKEIQASEEKVKAAQKLRKQRTSEIFSLFRLKALVSKLIMPKVQQRRRDKAAAELARLLANQAVRRNYLNEKDKRKKAAMLLQGAGRGLLARKKVKEMHDVATKTQSLFRARLAKRTLHGLREERAEQERVERERQLELRRNIAACRIARNMRVFTQRLKEEKNSAAVRLQTALRGRLNFKAAKKVANERRAERDQRSEEERRLVAELAAAQEAERRRQEEDSKRQTAALKLTRALSVKYVALLFSCYRIVFSPD